jgi:cobalt-zinc-cadmium efflux system outer membrane protein
MAMKLHWLFCAAVLAVSVTQAQELRSTVSPNEANRKALTLDEAIGRAMRANPEIAVATREVQANAGLVRQAEVVPNPELAYLMEDLRKETRTTTVQLNQRIELGGKRAARVEAAQRGADIAEIDLASRRLDVRIKVISVFYSVLTAQERYRIARDSLQLANKVVQMAARRVTAGKASPLDETKARVARAAAQLELAQVESELTNARNSLAALWGEHHAAFDRVEGEVSTLPSLPTWPELQEKISSAPELARARLEAERRHAMVRVERSKRMGDLVVTVGNKRDETLGRDQTVVGFSVPLPLFDRNQGNLQEALSRSYQAEDELRSVQTRIANELSQVYQRLKVAREEAALYQTEVLPDANTAYRAATKGFEYGKFAFIEVLDAQRTLFQAESQYLRALSEAHITAAEIERIVGNADTLN